MVFGMTLEDYLTRSDRKISYTDFGERIGVSQAAVSRYVSGARFPSPEIIRKIHDATNGLVTVTDMLASFEIAQKSRALKAAAREHAA